MRCTGPRCVRYVSRGIVSVRDEKDVCQVSDNEYVVDAGTSYVLARTRRICRDEIREVARDLLVWGGHSCPPLAERQSRVLERTPLSANVHGGQSKNRKPHASPSRRGAFEFADSE